MYGKWCFFIKQTDEVNMRIKILIYAPRITKQNQSFLFSRYSSKEETEDKYGVSNQRDNTQ